MIIFALAQKYRRAHSLNLILPIQPQKWVECTPPGADFMDLIPTLPLPDQSSFISSIETGILTAWQ